MARGAEAKARIIRKLKESFGEDFIGEYDKKIYLWSYEDGDRVQIAINMTCPKNFIEVQDYVDFGEGINFVDEPTTVAVSPLEPPEISKEEEDNLSKMLERLGLL